MKTLVLLVTTIVMSTSSALAAHPKDEACNQYFSDVSENKSAEVRLASGLIAFNAAFELNLNPNQLTQLRAHFDKMIATYPNHQIQIEKSIYFGCTTALASDDIAEARELIKDVIKN
ncbi:MAG: hypothetical protein SGJ18_16505 [Pseudomonadota bacterium]|nr:hypothetical protein [Pseudomonadota bacterium]